ncbi:ankyrin repeat-containing domain protein, partial [Colletotrichum phormii]
DIAHLARTCKRFSKLVTPFLFDYDIKKNYASSLLLSAKRGNYPGIIESLRYGADANTKDHTEFTIEHTPYEETYQKTWRRPLETDLTSLHWAAFNRDEKSLALLIHHGADASLRTDIWPTLRAMPSSKISMGVLSQRLRLGANALYFAFAFVADDQAGSYTTTNTSTPVRAVMDLLIAAGASLTTHESTQLNSLHQACANWDAVVASLLLTRYKVDPNIRDAFGNTPLHHFAACQLKDRRDPEPVIQVLTDHGAHFKALNASGMTPIDLAKKYRQDDNVIA